MKRWTLQWMACFALSAAALQQVFAQVAETLPVSKGVYRIPYAVNTDVDVTRDHENHGNNDPTSGNLGPRNRLDMVGQNGITIVAAADGWIEYRDDTAILACPNDCTGYDGPAGPGNCCERSNPACSGACRNNHVWMRHPNGEWTKYSHLRTDTIPDALQVGDFVTAGTVLGAEGDIGLANGSHLHFEVAYPLDLDDSLPPGHPDYDPLGMDGDPSQPGIQCQVCGLPGDGEVTDPTYHRRNRIPVFCDSGIVYDNEVVLAGPCDGECLISDPDSEIDSLLIPDNQAASFQRPDLLDILDLDIASGGGAAVRAGGRIRLLPGFSVASDGYFSASIQACDSPGT